MANDNLNKLIKNGSELIGPLQKDLRLLMWENCGVMKNSNLPKGLNKIQILNRFKYLDVRIYEHNCESCPYS